MKYSVRPYTENTVVVIVNDKEIGVCAEGMEEDLIKSLQK